jgi:hypothetical protein
MKQSYQWIKLAHDKGYRIKDGKWYNPKGKEIGYINNDSPYKKFRVCQEGIRRHIGFHKLVAYQLYGEDAFKPNVVIRHLDDNSLNNEEDNIGLGTHLENIYDMSSEKRSRRSFDGRKTAKRLLEGLEQIILQEHNEGISKNQISKNYNIHVDTVRKVIKNSLLK